MQDRYCLQMAACNGGCESGDMPEINDGTPVGTIISYMGTKAPKHYLACDGSEFNIADYPQLTQQIIEEFGRVDYFGGNGITAFAVPDLQNEFLRGYHGKAVNQLSGEIGRNQEATKHVSIVKYPETSYNSVLQAAGDADALSIQSNADTTESSNYRSDYSPSNKGITDFDLTSLYTSRPTNVAVLFCIKYE